MKKNIRSGILPFLLGIIFLLISQNVTANENINWKEAESDDDFVGVWESDIVLHIPKSEETFMPESSFNITFTLDYRKPAGFAGNNFKLSIKMDLGKFLTDWTNEPFIRMLGFSKDDLWALFLGEINSGTGIENITIEKYFISYSLSERIESFANDESIGSIFINDDKTKIKLILGDDVITLGLGDMGFSEIIMDRKPAAR